VLGEYLGLLSATPEAAALRQIIEIGISIVGADEGSLLVLDSDAGDLRFAMTVGSKESEQMLRGQRVPIGEGVTGLAAATRQVQVGAPRYRDINQTERLSDGPESVIAAPLLMGETVIGVLTAVTQTKGRRFSAKEAELYARFASIAALLVEQTHLLTAYTDDELPPAALGEAGRLERDILLRLRRIVAHRPSALAPLARILEGIEDLAGRASI
jgi:transcriptional regulator with GAF, ATPase, and Fis domain